MLNVTIFKALQLSLDAIMISNKSYRIVSRFTNVHIGWFISILRVVSDISTGGGDGRLLRRQLTGNGGG
jgi:hypothetical protein